MDYFTSCPFCHLTLPSSELQRHANGHFEDDDKNEQLASDLELAQQLASMSTLQLHDSSMDTDIIDMDAKICCLMALQRNSSFYHIKAPGGLMAMLCKRLELDADSHTTAVFLSGYVDHFQSLPYEDAGWGCGWRNIQMLASHLLSCRQEARQALFGGSAFVPDIPCLQRWLEIAWQKGFDALGSHHFNHSIYGSKHWIGTTECAALFRSFGLRARIVDFGPKQLKSSFLSVPGTSLGSQLMTTNARGKRKAFQVYGPMDRYLLHRNHDVSQPDSVAHDKYQCSINDLLDQNDHTVENKFSKKNGSHQVLLDWVWNYFSEASLTSAHHRHVVVTNRAPLYFQHDGHSRTIVGIQVRRQKNDMPQYNLLVLDPAHMMLKILHALWPGDIIIDIEIRFLHIVIDKTVERSLQENVGWKELLKRGVHTLKKSQYQLCYIDPGIASEEEMEQLKTIDSVFIEL